MNFTTAGAAPIGITIDGKKYLVPRMRRRDYLEWAAEVDASRAEDATRDMTPGERAKFLTIFPIAPVDHDDLARRVFTPAGSERILRLCLKRAAVPDDLIEKVLEEGSPKELGTFTLMLASVIDPDQMAAKADGAQAEGEASDPLASAGSGSPA